MSPSSPGAELVAALRATCQRAGLRSSLLRPEEVEEAIAAVPKALQADLLEVLAPGETYFFRQPQHFTALAALLPQLVQQGSLRIWSAGCATGEEAYSLAAWAHSVLGPQVQVEVLGTDLSARRLAVARNGVYRPWSRRESGPQLAPVVEERDGALHVLPRVRASVRFCAHNLLDPLPPGEHGFQLIFCRNVLIYLEDEACRVVCGNLEGALASGGVIAFGPVDVGAAPQGLVRFGPPEANFFRRPAPAPATAPVPPPRNPAGRPSSLIPASPGAPRPVALEDPVDAHLRALALAEQERPREALRVLERLSASHRTYLPALLERALLLQKLGERSRSLRLARALAALLSELPGGTLIQGPQALSADFYLTAARALLSRGRRSSA